MPKSLKNIIDSLKAKLPPYITFDETTYFKFDKPAKFIDDEYGEYWMSPKNASKGQRHKARAYKARNVSNKLTVEEAQSRLPPHIQLIKNTYVNTHKKCQFIDTEYGQFTCSYNRIYNGANHPARAKANTIKAHTYTKKHIESLLPNDILIDWPTYTNASSAATFIDSKYGKWNTRLRDVLDGHRHPSWSGNTSKPEVEIKEWLASIGEEAHKRRFNRCEFDLVIEKHKIAIEYNGLYWHSESMLSYRTPHPSRYHFNKMKVAEKMGYRLITIFEDEWLNKKKQVKGFILAVLKKGSKIGARNCSISKISLNDADKFLDDNHIQGSNGGRVVAFGLYNKNLLVGVMTLGRHPRNSKDIVLDRLCFLDGVAVVGGASKLFIEIKKWAVTQNYKKIISWSDNRWTVGNVYAHLDFKCESELSPDYSYIKRNKRYSKQSLKKNIEEKKLSLSEKGLRLSQGYVRIWDCGKKRWTHDL